MSQNHLAIKSNKAALVVLSGGQDSATCLYWAKDRFEKVEAITFDYGQRHRVELDCAKKLCELTDTHQIVVPINSLKYLSANALTDDSIDVAKDGGYQNLPSTFVPGRNALFLTMAVAYAAPRGITEIVTGVCDTDYSGYPDCREEFVDSMEKSLSLAVDTPIKIHRPLMQLSKKEIFELAHELGALKEVIEHTQTCYLGVRDQLHIWGYGCGKCPACLLRQQGFEEFIADPSKEMLHA
jgi:7-cyano-7-deazaguanine synthase